MSVNPKSFLFNFGVHFTLVLSEIAALLISVYSSLI